MKKLYFRLLTICIIIICCQNLVYADSLFVGEDGNKTQLNTKELMETLFTEKSVDEITFLAITKSDFEGDNASEVDNYLQKMSTNIYGFLREIRHSQNMIESRHSINHIIKIRNKLIDSGCFVNLCIAGSITSALNILFLDNIIQGNSINEAILRKDQLTLNDILSSLEKCDFAKENSSEYNYKKLRNQKTNKAKIVDIFTQQNINIHKTVTLRDWSQLTPNGNFNFGFNKKLLDNVNFSNVLYNFLFLLDQQFSIRIINAEIEKNTHFLDQNPDEIKKHLDDILQSQNDQFINTTLARWTGRRVYDFVRKYKFAIQKKDTTRFDNFLNRFLLSY